ncbi:hypothetical protein L9F63_005875, partial [Diploptera punctata]
CERDTSIENVTNAVTKLESKFELVNSSYKVYRLLCIQKLAPKNYYSQNKLIKAYKNGKIDDKNRKGKNTTLTVKSQDTRKTTM